MDFPCPFITWLPGYSKKTNFIKRQFSFIKVPVKVKMKGFEITNSWYKPPDILASQHGLTTLFFKPVAKKPPKPKPVVSRQELFV